MSEEKRSKPRLPVAGQINVRVIDTLAGRAVGKLANVHEEGFMLISEQGLVESEHIYQLLFEDEKHDELFRLGAECLWLNAAVGDQIWAGFQIIDIADEQKLKVDGLVQRIKNEQ